MLTSGLNVAFIRSADVREQFMKFAYPEHVFVPIGLAALIGSILYLIPQTAILGAILLTGYLGGAVASHVRIDDPTMVAPMVVGVLIWLGFFKKTM